jgi:hypothetical protein
MIRPHPFHAWSLPRFGISVAFGIALACTSGLAEPEEGGQGNSDSGAELLVAASVGGTDLILGSVEGICAIRKTEEETWTQLSVSTPCGFVRTRQDNPAQTFFYDGVGHVLVIAGRPAAASEYAKDGRSGPQHICSDEGQPVFVREGALRIGARSSGKNAFCHLLGFDEKDFYAFAFPLD